MDFLQLFHVLLKLLMMILTFVDAVVSVGEIENKVALETNDFNVYCTSKVPPVWNWVGKNVEEMKSMAVGSRKQVRFKEPRYLFCLSVCLPVCLAVCLFG